MLDSSNQTISKWTGMFADKRIEQQYQNAYLTRSKNQLRRVSLILGILFFLFLVYDFSSNSQQVLVIIFFCRLTFLLLSILFYLKSDLFLKTNPFLKITLYELCGIILFFTIVIVYEKSHFLFQAFAINFIILGIFFLIPNLLYNNIILAFFALIGYLIISLNKYQPSLLDFSSVLGYISLAILFSSMSSYSLGKFMRLDYFNNDYFKELSTKDSLTNTYNRLKFNDSLSRQIEIARRYGSTFSLIMFDIDHFKQFNDQNGHIFGDMILIEIADLVKESVRGLDILARWGGEEFVILLPQTNCQEAAALAERLRKLIHKESLKKGIALTCSFGVTSFYSEDDEGLIMERVDRALYKAKGSGRNVVVSEHNPDIKLDFQL